MKMLEKGQKSQKAVKCPVVGCSNKDPIVKVGSIHFSSRYQLGFSGSPLHRPRDSEEGGKTEEEIKGRLINMVVAAFEFVIVSYSKGENHAIVSYYSWGKDAG